MLVWILIQVVVNILLALGIFVLWSKLKKPPQDDPRLSKGLQLLQSKISVLEDLSDRTEVQFKQINTLIDEKLNQVRKKVVEASDMVHKIDLSMQKSLEVAEIFQDKIPHEEIIERQNTAKYAKAAKMAFNGATTEEICEALDIPEAEVAFIMKVNKDEMRFNETQLPAWVFPETKFEAGGEAEDSLKKLGDEFRKACADFDTKEQAREFEEQRIRERKEQIVQGAKQMSSKFIGSAENLLNSAGDVAKTIGKEVGHRTEELSKELFHSLEQKAHNLEKQHAPTEPAMDTAKPLGESSAQLSLNPEVAQAVSSHQDRISLSLDGSEKANPAPGKKTHVVGGNPNEEKVIKKVVFPTVDLNDPMR